VTAPLDDLGISRSLLSQGISSWPWKSDMEVNSTALSSKRREIKAAIKELQALNDKELADIGISRGEITHVVKFGHNRAA